MKKKFAWSQLVYAGLFCLGVLLFAAVRMHM